MASSGTISTYRNLSEDYSIVGNISEAQIECFTPTLVTAPVVGPSGGLGLQEARGECSGSSARALSFEERRQEFETTGTFDEIELRRKELSSLDGESQGLLTAYQMGHWTDADVVLRMKSINERKELHSRDLERMESELGDLEHRATLLDAFASRAQAITSRMNELTDAEKGSIIRALVPKIAIGKIIEITLVIDGNDATNTDASDGTVNGNAVATQTLDTARMRPYNESRAHT